MSEKGMYFYDGYDLLHSKTQEIQIIDVTGAGDIVISIFAYLIHQENNIQKIMYMATKLATLSVQKMGTYVLQKEDFQFINPKKIVFTNGFFDILHLGHLNLLRFAKTLGDILIVGLNSDTSVKNLKGKNRPIQNEITRKKILESLSFVDKVYIFEEETPLRLIKRIKPNIIVKGGDYKKEDVVGSDLVDETIIDKIKSSFMD